jgi:exosortase E/protease (VPEID-CTERM system)
LWTKSDSRRLLDSSSAPNMEVAEPRPFVVERAVGRSRYVLRATLLAFLMAAELVHLGIPIVPSLNPTLNGWWLPIVLDGRKLGEAALGGVLVTVFLSWPIVHSGLLAALAAPGLARRNLWLAVHLLCVGFAVAWLACGMATGNFTATGSLLWFLTGTVLLPATAITWSNALVPSTFWLNWLMASPGAFIAGAITAILTRTSNTFIEMLWPPLCRYTFVTVDLILHALQLPVVSDPNQGVLGTTSFAVRIAPACSGLEGIALICAFIAAYLWFYRADYRFPAALALFPTGIAIIWVLNAVRITVLILIGQWNRDLAVTGFHTVAGWIFFNFAALGLVSASHRSGWLSHKDHVADVESAERGPNPALPYLTPLLVIIGVAMVTAPFADGFDAAYPLRVVIAALAVWWYRERIGAAIFGFSWASVGLGTLCFLSWIALTHPDRAADAVIAGHLSSLSIPAFGTWTLFRLIGAIITVPVAEELFFRGYLQRKLIASDFEAVPFGRFTGTSFIVSSLAFGLLHQSWIAGVIAGSLFALAVYRRGRLADAITAHATANALLAVYVLVTGAWSLWT